MGNLVDLPGINVDALTIENNSSEKRTSAFSSQNYLNVRLEKGEKKKTVTISHEKYRKSIQKQHKNNQKQSKMCKVHKQNVIFCEKL